MNGFARIAHNVQVVRNHLIGFILKKMTPFNYQSTFLWINYYAKNAL